MRQFVRPTLDKYASDYFDTWTAKIKRKRKPNTKRAEAKKLWKSQRQRKSLKLAVEKLVEMNSGLDTCMYCEHDQAAEIVNGRRQAIIEHWEPIVEAPERAFVWQNHFLSCQRCNSFLKKTQFPRDASGLPLLIDPATEDPMKHIELEPSTGKLKELTLKGKTTIELFQLDKFEKPRVVVWLYLKIMLRNYDDSIAKGDLTTAAKIKQDMLGLQDHRSVLKYLVKIAAGPSGKILTDPDIPDIILRYGVATWT